MGVLTLWRGTFGRHALRSATMLCLAVIALAMSVEAAAARAATAATVQHAGSSGEFTSVAMGDAGEDGDATAGDGVFTARVSAYADDLPRYLFTYTLPAAEQSDDEVDAGTTPTTLVINELMASNGGTIEDPQGDDDDWIELLNWGTDAIDLSGMYLSDKATNPLKWQFPEGTAIAADGYLLVWADDDSGDSPGLHTNFKLSAGGESVVLSDIDARDNVVIDSVDFPALATDVSYGRSPEATGAFSAPVVASPGRATPVVPEIAIAADGPVTEGGTATLTISAAPPPSGDLAVGVQVTQGRDQDYLPASPPTSATVPAGASEALLGIQIPNDTVDEPNGLLTVTLTSGQGYVVASPASASLTVRDDDASPAAAAVVINELMASNGSTVADPQGEYDDWIELFNTTASAIDLSGMYLSDRRDRPKKWQFPEGTSIRAGGRLLVWADDDSGDSPGLHANFKLSAGGESVVLSDTEDNGNAVIDAVDFPELARDEAYARTPEGVGSFRVTRGGSPGTAPPPSSDAALSGLSLTDVDIGTFSAETTTYRASVDRSVATTTVEATSSDANAQVTITPADADADAAGHQVALARGSNEISIEVTAEDGETVRAYAVTVMRVFPPLTASFEVTAVPSEVEEGGTSTVTVSITNDVTYAADATIALSVSGGVDATDYALAETVTLAAGSSAATTVLSVTDDTAEEAAETARVAALIDGEEIGAATVTVAASDLASDDASLAALALSEVDIGAFAGETTSYAAAVPYAVDASTVTATAGDAGAVVDISPADADANAPGHQVTLAVGANEIVVTVTAEDGATRRRYAVTVTRASAPRAVLAADASPVMEGTAATFTVTLDKAPGAELTVSLGVDEDGAMLSGEPAETVTIGAEETSARLEAATTDDLVVEADSTVTATLTAGWGYELGARTSATVTVADDDTAEFEVAAAPAELEEGGTSTVTVSITNGVTYGEDREVLLTVTGLSAADYTLNPTTPTLASGEAAVTATLAAIADGVAEEPETARIEVTLDGSALGSASVAITDPESPPEPVIQTVAQVGGTLEATFEEAPQPDVAYQWLRGEEEIAGATAVRYAPTAADVGRPLSVRVERRGASRTSAATDPVWAAPSNPPLAEVDEELLGTVLTLESTDAFLVDIAGYGQLGDVRFGSLAGGDFEVGGTRHAVTTAAVNNQGRFVLGTRPHLTGTEGLTVYWNGYRMRSFAETTLVGERYWETAATQPKSEYGRYWDGASDGVRVALSIRRPAPVPAVSIAAVAGSVAEGGDVEYTVTADEAPRADLAVSVSVTDEAAALVSAPPATVTVAAGAMSVTLTLATEDDAVDEADGAVTVELLAGAGYELGAATSATATVTDDDVATFAVTAEPAEIEEGGTSTVTVSVTNGVTYARERTVELSVSGVSESDYALTPAALVLRPGEVSVTATLTAVVNEETESPETATVTARVEGVAVGSAAVAIRDASADASLSDLSLMDVDIGAFDSETTVYAAEVDHNVAATTVEATPTDANASVEITDAVGSTLGTERTSTLEEGANEIAARVTAEDGATRRTYAVTVTRAAAPPAWGTRLPGRDIALADLEAPSGVWSDGDTVWVTDRYEVVRAYALSDGGRLSDRDLDVGSDSILSALWSDGETLWVGDYYGGVLAHRLSDGARLASRDLDAQTLTEAGNDRPTGLWSDGETLWVADNEDAHVYAYGASGGARAEGQEFGLRTGDVKTGWPWGVWSDGETALVSWYRRGKVYAYRLSDGARQRDRDIGTAASGNADPQGLWSDGETLWVVDGADRKLYAYAVPGLRRDGGELADLPLTNRAAGVPGTDPGPPVSIPDAGLRARVGAALGKAPGGLIGANELAALTVLDARDADVTDLAGLERAVNLEGLDLGLNPLVDLRVLESLPALRTLNLDGTSADPWALAALTRLERLSLRDNGIEELDGLSSLTGLEVLDLGNNRIADIGPVSRLAELSALRLDGNAVADLVPLAGLRRLATLDVRDNRVTDVAPLAGLPGLVRLEAGGNRIGDFSVLEGIATLRVFGADEQIGLRAPR